MFRVDAERGATPVDVGVQVDETGRHDQAGHIANNSAGVGFDVRTDARNLAAGESHIGDGVELLRRVETRPPRRMRL